MISPRAAPSDINVIPTIACNTFCAAATTANDAIDSRHDNIMFVLKKDKKEIKYFQNDVVGYHAYLA